MIKHFRRWNIWRKRNCNSWPHKLFVLLGITKSPTMGQVWLPEEQEELAKSFEEGIKRGLAQRVDLEKELKRKSQN